MYFRRTNKPSFLLAVALIGSTLGTLACAHGTEGPRQAELPKTEIRVGETLVTAEVANTDQSRQTGLMNRARLGKNNGMLFVFRRSDLQCMWMKNTLIDLDVAFADEFGIILNVAQMKAGTSDIHCSKGNAKLALEMNLNWFYNNGISPGQVMQIPESVKLSKE